jgi:hypothetical protein
VGCLVTTVLEAIDANVYGHISSSYRVAAALNLPPDADVERVRVLTPEDEAALRIGRAVLASKVRGDRAVVLAHGTVLWTSTGLRDHFLEAGRSLADTEASDEAAQMAKWAQRAERLREASDG